MRYPIRLIVLLAAMSLGLVRTIIAQDCSSKVTLAVKSSANEPKDSLQWTWTISVANAECTPSLGTYQYDLVYKASSGSWVSEPRSGEGWTSADSESGETTTREKLPAGASKPRLEKLVAVTCACT